MEFTPHMISSKEKSRKNLLRISEARAVNKEKINMILSFMLDETYTTIEILKMLLKLRKTESIKKIMYNLKTNNIIWEKNIAISSLKKLTVYGLTLHGRIMISSEENIIQSASIRRVSRNVRQYKHTLMLQKIRIRAQHAGWKNWEKSGYSTGIGNKDAKVDGICKSPDGKIYAIEYERTLKSIERYRSIINSRLQAIKRNGYHYIVWISDNTSVHLRLKKILFSIDYVIIHGTVVHLEKDKHYSKMMCINYADWPIV